MRNRRVDGRLKVTVGHSRPMTPEEREKWLKKLSPSKYSFHLGKKG